MQQVVLSNKPLTEALLEIRWALQSPQPGFFVDPYYQVLIGRYYSGIVEKFSHWQKLPLADFPEMGIPHKVQHQFRVKENGWPLIQLGPGVLTVNETEGYTWEKFKELCLEGVRVLFEAYPEAEENLQIERILLRYIDADYLDGMNSKDFLRQYLKIDVNVPDELFKSSRVKDEIIGLNLRLAFQGQQPEGEVVLHFRQGKKSGRDALIWETIVSSQGEQTPSVLEEIDEWLTQAHDIAHEWFMTLIDGELYEKYK